MSKQSITELKALLLIANQENERKDKLIVEMEELESKLREEIIRLSSENESLKKQLEMPEEIEVPEFETPEWMRSLIGYGYFLEDLASIYGDVEYRPSNGYHRLVTAHKGIVKALRQDAERLNLKHWSAMSNGMMDFKWSK